MDANKTVCVFKTRVKTGTDPRETTATLDWAGVTPEQLRELAVRSIVIAIQSTYRIAEVIPATDDVNVAKLLQRQPGGFKLTPETALKKLGEMELTPEQKAFLRKLASS